MFIETTFMRYGHESGGLIGITQKPGTVAKWALSLHIFSQLRQDLRAMKGSQNPEVITTHKEEKSFKKEADATDRDKLRDTLNNFVDPLEPGSHPTGLLNIATGLLAPSKVNADKSVTIGTQQMEEFESGWPESFNKSLNKRVVTMSVAKKSIKIDDTPVYDTELIFNRVIGLQQSRDINIKDVLMYELSPVPAALFDDTGEMRSQAKASLKKKLQIEVSSRLASSPGVVIIDGCAFLWTVHWPANGTVEDYLKNFLKSLMFHLRNSDVYLIFDRYNHNSTKNMTRSSRAGTNVSRKHQLSLQTQLPTQKVVLAVPHNKKQLIGLLCQYLVDHVSSNINKLVITGESPVPVQLCEDTVIDREDLRTTHEEADTIIVQQMVKVAGRGSRSIKVVCDDTDVFILMLYFYNTEDLTCDVSMESPIAGRRVIDIKATAIQHKELTSQLPAAHALTGCDTVSFIFGIGKVTAVKALHGGCHLRSLGEEDANMDLAISEATVFIAACYGSKEKGNMSAIRHAVWTSKIAKPKITSAPKLKCLPPTREAFVEHVRRAHYQTAVWKAALSTDPPKLDPLEHGWSMDETNQCLRPVTIPAGVLAAPTEVLQMIKCGCSSARPCSTGRCGCVSAQMSCSTFCSCSAQSECCNDQTRAARCHEDDDEDDDDIVPDDS